MIDIESYFLSLRTPWVIRFVNDGLDNWKLIPFKYVRQFGNKWLSSPIYTIIITLYVCVCVGMFNEYKRVKRNEEKVCVCVCMDAG